MTRIKQQEPITQVMTHNPIAISLQSSISEVGRIFLEGKIHHLPVVEGKELVGIVSYTDLMRVSFEQSFGVIDAKTVYAVLDQTLTIESIMTPDPVCIGSPLPFVVPVCENTSAKVSVWSL